MIQIVGLEIDDFWQEMRRIIREEVGLLQREPEVHPAEYSTKDARAALAAKGRPPIDYKTFRKHLALHGIQPYRRVGRTKYYLHSDLFKPQTFK